MFHFMSSTTLSQVFFGLCTGLPPLPIALLQKVRYSHPYVLHDQTISTLFSLVYVQGSLPNNITFYDKCWLEI